MKNKFIILTIILALSLSLSGCEASKAPEPFPESNNQANLDYQPSDDVEVKSPVIDWWKLYKNNNKTNTVTIQVSNPNNFAIGFKYDLVFYKNDIVVKTEKNWAMTGIDANDAGIIYGDIKIPSSDSVDRIELENIETTKFEWKTINGTFEKTFIDKDQQYFDVTFKEKPNHTEIWAVLYNDINKNKKIEANEFVAMGALAPFINILELKGEITIPIPDEQYNYTDYEIYCFAFTTKN